MENDKRLIDANNLCKKIKEISEDAGFYRAIYDGFLKYIECSPSVDAVEVVRIEEVKREILQQMNMFIEEYNRIGFYGKSDVMDIAKRLVNAALTDLCDNCGEKMEI